MKILKSIDAINPKETLKQSNDKIDINFETGKIETIQNGVLSTQYLSEDELASLQSKLENHETFDENNEIQIQLGVGIIVTIIGIIVGIVGIVTTVVGLVNGGRCTKTVTKTRFKETTKYSNGSRDVNYYTEREVSIDC